MTASGDAQSAKTLDVGNSGWIAMQPVGIRACSGGGHPVLLLVEVGGSRLVTVRVDEDEAQRLAAEFAGTRQRHSRTYETLEGIVSGLGAEVAALRLTGDKRRGLSGEIEVAGEGRQAKARAHPGDVAALARRLGLSVDVPAGLARLEPDGLAGFGEWHRRGDRDELPASSLTRRVLPEPRPEDYDW